MHALVIVGGQFDHHSGDTGIPCILVIVVVLLIPNTSATVVLHDPVLNRRLTVSKSHSNTTVILNPGAELSAKMADLSPQGWKHMVCIETANALENSITLGPGEQHSMTAHIKVDEEQNGADDDEDGQA